ncbi:chymotrypsinogen B-like [Liolophura sinensis]|uniref:chymotrypsinogen B-like n=1 Tax=Liolophura sinensis TaxID=3198878 RepID=UPI00315969CA
MRVIAGATRISPLERGAEIHYFKKVITPYGLSIYFDVALIEFEIASDTNRSDVTPIQIANETEPVSTGDCRISGWGTVDRLVQRFNPVLKEARTKLLTIQQCKDSGWPVTATHVCAEGRPKGVSGCFGDSGGPLTCYRTDGTPVLMGKPTSEADRLSAFIVGGTRADTGKHPWQLSLQVRLAVGWGHSCGAVLIAENWAVTASHCLFDRRYRELRVMAGSSNLLSKDSDVQIRTITHAFAPLGFSVVYDVAVLKLENPVNTSRDSIAPIVIANLTEPSTTGNCMISGWGLNAWNAEKSFNLLQDAPVNLIAARDCNDPKWPVFPTQVCSEGQRKGSSACYGDSGGPLTCTREDGTPVLVGLGSYVYKRCQTVRPNVFSRVAVYRRWLRRVTKIEDL